MMGRFDELLMVGAALVLVLGLIASIAWLGMVATERPACSDRARYIGASNSRYEWRTGCLIQIEENGPYVSEDLLRVEVTGERRGASDDQEQ